MAVIKQSKSASKPASFNRPKPAAGKAKPIKAQSAPDTSKGSTAKNIRTGAARRDAAGKF
jgi:hypothetical protein